MFMQQNKEQANLYKIQEDWRDRNGKTENGRQRAMIFLRVMGYYSCINSMNIGKKSEVISRKNFSIVKSNNSKFINQYGN